VKIRTYFFQIATTPLYNNNYMSMALNGLSIYRGGLADDLKVLIITIELSE